MSSKASKRRGRPIIVDGTTYYWKVRISNDLPTLYVFLPTGRRVSVPYYQVTEMPDYDIAPPGGGLEITPSAVASFIRHTVSR